MIWLGWWSVERLGLRETSPTIVMIMTTLTCCGLSSEERFRKSSQPIASPRSPSPMEITAQTCGCRCWCGVGVDHSGCGSPARMCGYKERVAETFSLMLDKSFQDQDQKKTFTNNETRIITIMTVTMIFITMTMVMTMNHLL